jgi:hypothetical protein
VKLLASAKILTLVGIASWSVTHHYEGVSTDSWKAIASDSYNHTGNPHCTNPNSSNVTKELVPFPNFKGTSEKIGNIWGDVLPYMGSLVAASPAVTRLLTAVSSSMSIVPVSAPHPNSSYSLQFYGPCLKCQSTNDAIRSPDFRDFEQPDRNYTSLSLAWDGF